MPITKYVHKKLDALKEFHSSAQFCENIQNPVSAGIKEECVSQVQSLPTTIKWIKISAWRLNPHRSRSPEKPFVKEDVKGFKEVFFGSFHAGQMGF